MNIHRNHIGARIQQALDARGQRAAALAQQLGVSRAAVSGWLKGDKLSVTHLIAIAGTLDVSLNWLVMGIGSLELAADSTLSPEEENLLRLLRHFGEDALQQALGMVNALGSSTRQPLKHFKGYDLVSRNEMPIAVLDADGFLVYSNVYHNRMLGLEDDGKYMINGLHFTEWIPKVFHRNFRTLLQDTLRKGHATYSSLHIRCPKTQLERKFIIHANAVSTPCGPAAHLLMKVIDNGTAPA